MRPHLGDTPADQAGLLFYSYVRDLLSFQRTSHPVFERAVPRLKALILFLEAPILILEPLVNDINFFDKFTEALILDFKALFEYLEESIRNRFFVCPGLISRRAFAL